MESINNQLKKLNSIALMEFFKFGGSVGQLPGPYRGLDKLKLIIYQLLEGFSNGDIPIPKSSYFRIYAKFWKKKGDQIIKWSNNWMDLFSAPQIRSLFSFIHSPPLFKHVTLFIDGKDIPQILNKKANELRPTKNNKSNLISRKNGWVTAGKVLFIDDIRGFPITLSTVVGANESYDGHLMKTIGIDKYINAQYDCIIYDHHFDSEFEKLIKIPSMKKAGYGNKNLCPSVSKGKKINLNPDQEYYQKQHSGFRSFQETERNAHLVNLFKRFSKHCRKRVTSFEELYLQLRVVLIIMGISRMVKSREDLFDDVDAEDIYRETFDFPEYEVKFESRDVNQLIANSNLMQNNQIKLISDLIDDVNDNNEDSEDNVRVDDSEDNSEEDSKDDSEDDSEDDSDNDIEDDSKCKDSEDLNVVIERRNNNSRRKETIKTHMITSGWNKLPKFDSDNESFDDDLIESSLNNPKIQTIKHATDKLKYQLEKKSFGISPKRFKTTATSRSARLKAKEKLKSLKKA